MYRQTHNRQKKRQAFTLIEVMIVLVIVSIMAGVMVVALGNARVKRELETNREQFNVVIREAQNNALTGKRISDRTPCEFFVTWAGNAYTLGYTYKDSGNNCTSSPTNIVQYPLKNGVQFSNSGSAGFAVPHAGLSSGSTIEVRFVKRNTYDTACIYTTGRVLGYPGSASCGS